LLSPEFLSWGGKSGVCGVAVVGADYAWGVDWGAVYWGKGRTVEEGYASVFEGRTGCEGSGCREAEDAGTYYEDWRWQGGQGSHWYGREVEKESRRGNGIRERVTEIVVKSNWWEED
jgi:hypothetical protein